MSNDLQSVLAALDAVQQAVTNARQVVTAQQTAGGGSTPVDPIKPPIRPPAPPLQDPGYPAGVVMGASGVLNWSNEVIKPAADGSLPPKAQLADGVRNMWDSKLGWTTRYVGSDRWSIDQQFLDAGGNVGNIADFKIFMTNHPELTGFATIFAAWQANNERSTAERDAADNQNVDFGEAWKAFKPTTIVDAIDQNFCHVMDHFGWMAAFVYLGTVDPTRVVFKYFPENIPMAKSIMNTFNESLAMNDTNFYKTWLHIVPEPMWTGYCTINNGPPAIFVVHHPDGTTYELELPFGPLNLRNGAVIAWSRPDGGGANVPTT